jgi:hypothetical protein
MSFVPRAVLVAPPGNVSGRVSGSGSAGFVAGPAVKCLRVLPGGVSGPILAACMTASQKKFVRQARKRGLVCNNVPVGARWRTACLLWESREVSCSVLRLLWQVLRRGGED